MYKEYLKKVAMINKLLLTVLCILGPLVTNNGNKVLAYTLPQQQRLLSAMIDDLRNAYHQQFDSAHKRDTILKGIGDQPTSSRK